MHSTPSVNRVTADAQPPDEQWLAGVRLMVTEPSLQGALARAHATAGRELAAAIADRTGTEGLYPRLVADVVGAATSAAIAEWLHGDPPRPMDELLSEALDQIVAGLPEPD